MKKTNKKLLIGIVLGGILAIGLTYIYCHNLPSVVDPDVVVDIDEEKRERSENFIVTLSPSNVLLANTIWYGDDEVVAFIDGEYWVKYDSLDNKDKNAIGGTYKTYYGDKAYDALDDKLFGKNAIKPANIENGIVLELTTINKENGEYLETTILYGSKNDDVLNLIDVRTFDSKVLSTTPKNSNATINIKDVLKDIVYVDNKDAWQSFEIKVNGKTIGYPYSASEFAGFEYKTLDEKIGEALLYNESTNEYLSCFFKDKKTDQIINIIIKNLNTTKVTLPNGISLGSSKDDVLSAYGEPSTINQNLSDETIYAYNLEDRQIRLYFYSDDTVSTIEINNFISNE